MVLCVQVYLIIFLSTLCTGSALDDEANSREWSQADIELVGSKIADMLNMHEEELSQRGQSQLVKRASMLRSCPFPLPDEFAQFSQNRAGCPLVVISVHPKQRLLVAYQQKHWKLCCPVASGFCEYYHYVLIHIFCFRARAWKAYWRPRVMKCGVQPRS